MLQYVLGWMEAPRGEGDTARPNFREDGIPGIRLSGKNFPGNREIGKSGNRRILKFRIFPYIIIIGNFGFAIPPFDFSAKSSDFAFHFQEGSRYQNRC